MASENRPGVVITQALTETPTVASAPTLVPVVMGPCYQIINAVTEDGDLNSDAQHSTKYSQGSMVIPQGNFPDPRGNIDELEIEEDSVQVFVSRGGGLTQLDRGSHDSKGSSFLERFSQIYRPAMVFDQTSFSLVGTDTKTLVFALDLANESSTASDITVTFDSSMLTVDDIVEAINKASNAAVGYDAAFKNSSNNLVIFSSTHGPAGSVNIKACSAIADAFLDTTLTGTYRVMGAGLCTQDDPNSLTASYIEYRVGRAYVGGVLETSWPSWAGYNTGSGTSHVWSSSQTNAVTFAGSNPTIPLKAKTTTTPGDYLVVNGARVSVNEVILVETNRFKLGTLNTGLSTKNQTTGEYTTRIYDTLSFGTLLNGVPFSPKNAYFIAQNLVWGEVTPAGSAAELTSSATNMLDARKAMVSGMFAVEDASNTPAYFDDNDHAMGGLTIVIQETISDVVKEEVVHTFEGSVNTMAEVAQSITDNADLACTAAEVNGYLVIYSSLTGANQSVSVKSNGTANSILGFSTTLPTTASGKDIEVAEQAVVTGAALVPSDFDQTDYVLTLNIVDSFGDRDVVSEEMSLNPAANAAAVRDAVATAFGGSGSDLTLYADGIPFATIALSASDELVLTSVEGGADVELTIATTTSSGTDLDFGFTNGQSGAGADLLKDTTLKFTLDGNPGQYEVDFDSNSLSAAVDAVNAAVSSSFDVASITSSNAMKLVSGFKGVASAIEIETSTADVSAVLDFATLTAAGNGRPNPDFYLNASGSAVVGANIVRDPSTGIPFSPANATVSLYVQYKALRHDVTAIADEPGLLTFSDFDVLDASIGPVSKDNPLALAAYLCMLNSPNVSVSCLGVDEVSTSHELGTVDAYMRALEFLESKEVYAIAPLTDDMFIQKLIATHVQLMSTPAERGERIVILWQDTPERAPDTSIEGGSGTGTQNNSDNQIELEVNVASEISDAGIQDLASVSVDDGLYIEISTVSFGSTSVSNYSVSKVVGRTLTLRTTFTGTQNSDGFYSETDFSGTASFASITYNLRVRGDELLITGTTLKDTKAITEAAAGQAAEFNHRRVFLTFGNSVDASVNGVSTNLPGYYIGAGIAGMIGAQVPQQPFTNLQMAAFTKVYGTDDTYSENQLDVIADGGRYVLVNQGAGISARHQRSTSNASIEARELSITKAIDYLSKGLRQVNRAFIGRYVITPGFLDQLTIANEGYLRRVENSVVRTAKLKSLLQSEAAPDTVLIEVEVQPAYPCNKIRITIVS